LPALGLLSALSVTEAAADGPAIVLPAGGWISATVSVPAGNQIAGDYVSVSEPSSTPLCWPCQSGQADSTVPLGWQPAGTTYQLAMEVYHYNIFGPVYSGTYYSDGSAGNSPGPGATVTQVNADKWSVAFEDTGATPNPDVIVTITDLPDPNGDATPAYQTSLLGNGNLTNNKPYPCAGDPVNCATGNFTESATDSSVPGRGPALDLTRTYNSLAAATTSPFGYGWSNSYSMSLNPDTVCNCLATITQENGATVSFATDTNGNWNPRFSGTFASLTHNADGTWTFVRRARSIFTFSATGQLISESDPNGYTTTLSYNGSAQLTTVTDSAGRTLRFTYGTNGDVVSVTDPAGNVTHYGYDTAGELASVTDPTGALTAYGYVADHLLTTVTKPDGGVLTNSYNSTGQVTQQSDPMGRTTSFMYGSGTTTITEANGSTTDETFNAQDELLSRTAAAGTGLANTTTYTYDPTTYSELSSTDGAGHTTNYAYDANGNRTTTTDPLGNVTAKTYNNLDEVVTSTTPLGITTTNTYDASGNLLSVSTPLSGTSSTQTSTYSYGDPSHPGDVTASTDPDGHITTFSHDAQGDVNKTTDPLGDVTTQRYSVLGEKIASTSPNGNVNGGNPAAYTTTYTYDQLGRLLTTTDPLGNATTNGYDGDGNLVSSTTPGHETTHYAYNADEQPVATTEPNGAASSTTYDAAGNVASQTDANGKTTTYGYNALNEKVLSKDALGNTTTYTYDMAGNLATAANPSGQITTYTYNADHKELSASYTDGTPNVAYYYDADGNLVAMTDGTGYTYYGYDGLDRVVNEGPTYGNPVMFYSYDLDNKLVGLTYPSTLNVTRTFDAAGRMTSVNDGGGRVTSFSYDPNGNMVTISHPDGSTDSYAYNADNQTRNVTAATTNTTLYNLTTPRNADGNVTSQTSSLPQSASVTTGYNYDAKQQLTGTTVGTGSLSTPASGFSYDGDGNMTTTSLAGQTTTTNTYNAGDELVSSTNPSGQGNTAFTYNAQGERTSQTTTVAGQPLTTNYTWNQAGELTGVANPALTAASNQLGSQVSLHYTYNGLGLLSTLSYDLVEGTPQIISDGIHDFIRGPGGLVVEELTVGAEPVYYHHDQLGSVKALTGPNGHELVSYTYSAYGASTASSTAVVNPFGFADSYTEYTSGLIYLLNRWYDPATAQFLSVDPLVSLTGAAYPYAGSDPVNETDPLGLWPGEGLVHDVLDLVALPVYATYYLPYEAGKAINEAGCSLGAIGCAISHAVVAVAPTPAFGLPIPVLEATGLAGDAGIDQLKIWLGLVPPSYGICDEGQNIPLLPRSIDGGGPTVHNAPGLRKNGGLDFEW
jgi:RHS repeat-associated protein